MPNETLNVKAIVDNTKCSKPLEKITAQLVRHIEARDGKWTYNHDEILQTLDFLGVPAF